MPSTRDVFSKGLGFRIGGVSVMPLRLLLADATAGKGRAGQAVTRGRASHHRIGDVLRPGGEPLHALMGGVKRLFIHGSQLRTFSFVRSARRKRTC